MQKIATGQRLKFSLLCTAAGLVFPALRAQSELHVSHGRAAQPASRMQPQPASRQVSASFDAAFTQANARQRGEAWLTFRATYTDPATHHALPVEIRVPLSSTEYPYGEERSCSLADPAQPRLIFSAGLDEKNYLPYRSGGESNSFEFSLNKYLCRVLAAPFRCGGKAVSLSHDLSRWTVAGEAGITLDADAPATLRSTPVQVATGGAFDVTQCPAIAPSNGLCCVEGRTTEWHCGGTPTGKGWHQVSGECFHRETGSSCKD